MVIVFSGAQGTGKSTVAKKVSDLTGIPLIESSSRSAWTAYFRLNGLPLDTDWKRLNFNHQIRYQTFATADYLSKLIPLLNEDSLFLMDRGVYDFLVYSRLKVESSDVNPGSELDYAASTMLRTVECMTKIAYRSPKIKQIWFRPDSDYPIEDNQIRDTSNQQRVDELFCDLKFPNKCLNGNYLQSSRGTIEEKTAEIIKFIFNDMVRGVK